MHTMKIIAGNPWLLICARFVAVVVVVVVSVVVAVAYYKRSEFYRSAAVPLFIIYESLFGMKIARVVTV